MDRSHGRLVQPIAFNKVTFSEPTLAATYCFHAKVHSLSPPSAMAWQYTVDFKFGEMLPIMRLKVSLTVNFGRNNRCDGSAIGKKSYLKTKASIVDLCVDKILPVVGWVSHPRSVTGGSVVKTVTMLQSTGP